MSLGLGLGSIHLRPKQVPDDGFNHHHQVKSLKSHCGWDAEDEQTYVLLLFGLSRMERVEDGVLCIFTY